LPHPLEERTACQFVFFAAKGRNFLRRTEVELQTSGAQREAIIFRKRIFCKRRTACCSRFFTLHSKYVVNDDGKGDSEFTTYNATQFKKDLPEKFVSGIKNKVARCFGERAAVV